MHRPAPVQHPLQLARSHVHAPAVHVCEGAQVVHAPPAVPHAAAVGGLTHWPFWSQQPFGHVVDEQRGGTSVPASSPPPVPPVASDPPVPADPLAPAGPPVPPLEVEPPVPPAAFEPAVAPPPLLPPITFAPPALPVPAAPVALVPALPVAVGPTVPPPQLASAVATRSAHRIDVSKRSESIGLPFNPG
jgi:homeobox protein ESX1